MSTEPAASAMWNPQTGTRGPTKKIASEPTYASATLDHSPSSLASAGCGSTSETAPIVAPAKNSEASARAMTCRSAVSSDRWAGVGWALGPRIPWIFGRARPNLRVSALVEVDARRAVVAAGVQNEGLHGQALDLGVGAAGEGAHLAPG